MGSEGGGPARKMPSTVLVADDEKNIVQLARLYLGNEGYRVEEANDGKQALTASVKVGDKEEKTEIPAGQSDTATFKAAEGLVVTLTVARKSTEVKYEKPADCAPALPVTGVNAGLLAGVALVLVSGGAGLYFVARRRRIRFAA